MFSSGANTLGAGWSRCAGIIVVTLAGGYRIRTLLFPALPFCSTPRGLSSGILQISRADMRSELGVREEFEQRMQNVIRDRGWECRPMC